MAPGGVPAAVACRVAQRIETGTRAISLTEQKKCSMFVVMAINSPWRRFFHAGYALCTEFLFSLFSLLPSSSPSMIRFLPRPLAQHIAPCPFRFPFSRASVFVHYIPIPCSLLPALYTLFSPLNCSSIVPRNNYPPQFRLQYSFPQNECLLKFHSCGSSLKNVVSPPTYSFSLRSAERIFPH